MKTLKRIDEEAEAYSDLSKKAAACMAVSEWKVA